MKDTKRALRRHHRQRLIAHAERIYRSREAGACNAASARQWACRNYNHLQRCSCWMCGHRRKWNGPTIQERRQNPRIRDTDD